LLRLGWFELRETGAPGAAVIHELVELAKRYSTERSPGFVNALLDSVRRRAAGEAVGTVPGVAGEPDAEAG
jgi:transcription termination factor NusB